MAGKRKTGMHYYKRNIGDYHKRAGRFSMIQHGACTLLTDACFDRGDFPASVGEACDWAWAVSPEDVAAVGFVVKKLFHEEGGKLVDPVIKQAIDRYRGNAETNRKIALNREEKRRKPCTVRAPTVNETPPNHKPLTTNQEPETKKKKEKPLSGKPYLFLAEDEEIFKYWVKVMRLGRAKFLQKRKATIRERRAEGFTTKEMMVAIYHCSMDAFYMGQNDRNKPYNDLAKHILISGTKVEEFIRNPPDPNKPPPMSPKELAAKELAAEKRFMES